MNLPRIAITMGDPAGVGPELCLRLLNHASVAKTCHPVVFGNANVLTGVANQLQISGPPPVIEWGEQLDFSSVTGPVVVDVGEFDLDDFQPGVVSAQTGRQSYAYIGAAIKAALSGRVHGVVTGPINKEAWQQAGIQYPGHTELFAERFDSDRFCMMMTSPAFSCSLVTTHVGYEQVPGLLETDRILEVIQLTHDALSRICGRAPKLTVLGLNPHAGEGGLFGNREEENLILPAIHSAAEQGINIQGPLPPDTAFLPWQRESTDGYICMYHDQGLIPFKALNFDTGVNITLGLPLVRTSVDHGTALDIAWQGKADVSSLVAAVELATQLSAYEKR